MNRVESFLIDFMSSHSILSLLSNLYLFDFLFYFKRRLLNLWLENAHRKRPWSIRSHMKEIDKYLLSIKYPSNSVRIPRSLTKHLKFKANELRAIFLFGFPAFCTVLPLAYARHFLLLVIEMHIAESKFISASDIPKVRLLI
jgi:hypothetical protein